VRREEDRVLFVRASIERNVCCCGIGPVEQRGGEQPGNHLISLLYLTKLCLKPTSNDAGALLVEVADDWVK
jgi:hypothetical protein